MSMFPRKYCVMCGKPATTTYAHILVCERHYNWVAEEAAKYLPDSQRPRWHELQIAEQNPATPKKEDENE